MMVTVKIRVILVIIFLYMKGEAMGYKIISVESAGEYLKFSPNGKKNTYWAALEDNTIKEIYTITHPIEKDFKSKFVTQIIEVTGKKYFKEFLTHLKNNSNYHNYFFMKELISDDLENEPSKDNYYYWNNPNINYYTYRITSNFDEKYYLGRKSIRKSNSTVKDCLNDGYWGSGGKDFKDWFILKYLSEYNKEIIEIQETFEDNIKAEVKLIENLYESDENCLNQIKGGYSSWSINEITIKTCEIHGEGKFLDNQCYTCRNNKSITMQECLIHGETKYRGATCFLCTSEKTFSIKECSIHGEANFKGDTCCSCTAKLAVEYKECPLHGLTKHNKNVCYTCRNTNMNVLKTCKIHGESLHRNEKCLKCINAKTNSIKNCRKHGETIFQGDKCSSCNNEKLISLKECSKHGVVKHRGDSCYKCKSEAAISLLECSKHGLTKHFGKNCCSCRAEKAYANRGSK